MVGVEFNQPAPDETSSRALSFGISIIDPRAWIHLLRLVHYYNYSHVRPRRLADIGPGVRMAPNVSMMNAERIKIGAYSHIGARCSLWAGKSVGRITLGHHALLGPEVFITAANYRLDPGMPIMDQPMDERDVIIGPDVWLGARVVVGAGVENRGRLSRRPLTLSSPDQFRQGRSQAAIRRRSLAGGEIQRPRRRSGKRMSCWAPDRQGGIWHFRRTLTIL